MLTTNNNDILFDDVALINQSGHSGQSATIAIIYNDCDNRYETAENLSPDCNCSGYTFIEEYEEFSTAKIA